jgi:hypothetical protein
VEYDLTRAYPEEAGLAQLRRRFELSGSGGGTVRLTDDVELRQPGTYRARFWTFLEPEIAADGSVLLFRPAPRGSLLQRAERHAGGAVGIVLACETAELGAPQLEYVPRAVLGRGDEAIGAYRIDFLSPVVRKLHAAFRLSTSKSQRSS